MFFQALEITLDGIANIRHRFVTSLALRNTAGQDRTFGDEHAILIRFNCNAKFHSGILAMLEAVRNRVVPSLKSWFPDSFSPDTEISAQVLPDPYPD